MRLDQYLYKKYNIQSRNKAKELITLGKVAINGEIVTKASFVIQKPLKISIFEYDFYVSRSAYKLKYFLNEIDENFENKKALDIGSSTGGFTQILLDNNISNIVCVDVGSNQLHEKIKNDKRVDFFENMDIRNFKPNKKFDIITCDVSFISINSIIKDINRLANNKIIILFKPQFEVGKNVKRDKKGAVKDKNAIHFARKKFIHMTQILNWKLLYNSLSKLKGKDGNEEELFYFAK